MRFSVLTATYNRANYLRKLYDSLVNNVSDEYEIEWLIMDDGSQDDTEKKVEEFNSIKGLEVKYFRQENQGKMQAINNLNDYVTGEFWIEVDSDDYFIENTLKIIAEKCKMFQEKKDNLYALAFLKSEGDGKLSGNKFPIENIKTTMFDLYYKYGVTGEKPLVFNTKIRKQYKYKLEKNENFCTEARLYNKIDIDYGIKCYNIEIIEGEYQQDGYTRNERKIFLDNPKGHLNFFIELLHKSMAGVLFRKRIYVIKHYILFSTICNEGINVHDINDFFNKFLVVILYIPGKFISKKNIKKWRKEYKNAK